MYCNYYCGNRGVTELALEAREVLIPIMMGSDGTSQGVASIKVDGASPQPGDGTRGLLWD
jgi:hypothetical protein